MENGQARKLMEEVCICVNSRAGESRGRIVLISKTIRKIETEK
jgi:hypothetical protein